MVSPALRDIVYRIQCLVAVCRRGHHLHFRRQPAARLLAISPLS
jgi:hypothetical protein